MIVGPLKRLLGNKRGGTAVEYGLIAALIVLTMMAAFIEVANTTTGMWGNVNNKMAIARAGG
jgi:pilus assembly protein Flp/PilA